MTNKKLKIGEILVSSGLITEDQLKAALSGQRQLGGTVGENLIRLGYISEEALLNSLSEQLETVRSRRLLPIGFEGKILVVGMVDPTDLTALSEVEFQSGHSTKPVILSSTHFEQALNFFQTTGYGVDTLKLSGEKLPRDIPAESNIGSLLKALVAWHGQDLHLSSGAIPSIRVDGEIKRLGIPVVKPAEVESMVHEILTPEQKRIFQENLELDFAFSLDGVGRFRCNVYRQRGSLAFTARHVADKIPPATELGIPDFLHEYALRKHGLILVTGPNGHGKTTTLANLVDTINRERKANIITIEDPIEYTHRHKNSNVNQREVGTDTNSFGDGLRHIFRQNPDVIVIGELRDFESFSIALTAAETGHLVMATMHSNNATAAVDRIIDIFPPAQQSQVRAQLADCLLAVFSQRLLRRASGSGRIMAWEKMSTSLRVRNAIREGKVHVLRGMMQTNVEELVSIDWTLADHVASGRVKYEEAMKYADSPTYLNELLKVRGAYR
jgi:twitching motility protein PilT